ncbi:glycosyltransferase [Pedobacter yulinensis]|uniref:Glycosyltransferase n=1 Tax=Pedobacter yulinensis TaxID=2126353 RepID=A0A2T3HSB0_9SPHI|nr:WecB/TagA/CpsF family glycosyltransferase [Pedobacter yulinensis]PST85267.1 glycosyltransferase [Pedobacter yulinensis]
MEKPNLNFLDYPIYNGDVAAIEYNRKCVVNTINQYSFCLAENDSSFKYALQKSDILLPDGVGITWAVKLLTGRKIKKIAGADLHKHCLEALNRTGGKCFYLGSSESTLKLIKQRLNREYPNILSGFHSPPYKPEFSQADNEQMIKAVNDFNPDVLFVGMTAPKQEKWVMEHKDSLRAGLIGSIGAVFDFYAGTVKRPNTLLINLKLEWFVRLLKEPKRMWRRYIYYGPIFIGAIWSKKMQNRDNNR